MGSTFTKEIKTDKVTSDPIAKVTSDPIAEGTSDPTAKVTSADPIAEGTSDPIAQVTSDQTAKVTSDPIAKVTSDPIADGTSVPIVEVTSDPTAKVTTDPIAEGTSDPIAEVEQGKLKGKLCKTFSDREFYSFRGIPYAKPPLEDLRFRAPEPPEAWQGVKDATQPCNGAPQYDKPSDWYNGEEDCLYLNVYTPTLATDRSALKPVMFFIHGGGFIFGQGTEDTLHGPDCVINNDIVLVSINYRLGILGFLSLDRKDAPGNMGLKDQVLALKWVQKNITKFGGDPNNVTIFGVSAGAVSVECLILSPMARDLFHKAIIQGGSSLCHWAQNTKVKELAATIPVLKGKGAMDGEQLLKYLKGLPTKELVQATADAIEADKFVGGVNFGFVPTIEKPGDWEPFLDKSTYDILSSGDFAKVPIISGICSREGLLMTNTGKAILENLVEERCFTKHLPFILDAGQKQKVEARLEDVYYGEGNVYGDDDFYAIDFFTDVIILGGTYTAAALMNKKNSKVYFYEFSFDGKLNSVKKMLKIKRRGACHADDGGYFLTNVMLPKPGKITGTDKLVRDRVVKLWTNFAKYGDPTPELDDLISTKWEPMDDTDECPCLVIDKELILKYGVYPERTNLFQELYQNYKRT